VQSRQHPIFNAFAGKSLPRKGNHVKAKLTAPTIQRATELAAGPSRRVSSTSSSRNYQAALAIGSFRSRRGVARQRQAARGLYPRHRFANRRSQSRNAASQFTPQSQPPMTGGTTQKHDLQKGWAMDEQEDRLARAREEIAARVASFKATQEKFEREREEYYATTLGNAWSGFNRPSFWT
jgi:hypothetical protein